MRTYQTRYATSAEDRSRQLRELDAPLILAANTTYRDTEFVVSPRFVGTSVRAALYGPAVASGIQLRNCVVRTTYPTWDPAWATDLRLRIAGLRLDTPRRLAIDGFHVEGMPDAGLSVHGIETAALLRISVTRCMVGANLGMTVAANRNVDVDGFRAWDTWGPPPGLIPGFGGAASNAHPGEYAGGDGFVAYLEDSTLRDLACTGELYGAVKLVRSKRLKLDGLLAHSLMIQGTQARYANSDGSTDGSDDIEVRRLYLAKRLGHGAIAEAGNGLQISFNVRGLDVREFVLLGDGRNGHAIQLWGDVEASFRGGIISGWNGTRGNAPAVALETGDGSRENDDFETANVFYEQERLVLHRIAG